MGTSSRSLVSAKDRYIPTHLRATGFSTDDNNCKREDQVSLSVANLSEDTTEHDLRDLFGQFGHITRVLIVLDEKHKSRGFGFVNFSNKKDALVAQEVLDGHGFANLILSVEFVKSRVNRNVSP